VEQATVPPAVRREAAEYRLGAYRGSYRLPTEASLGAGSVLLFFAAAFATFTGFAARAGHISVVTLFTPVTGLFLAVGLRHAAAIMREPVAWAHEFDRGIVRASRLGEVAFPWHEVSVYEAYARVTGERPRGHGRRGAYRLRRADGREVWCLDDGLGMTFVDRVNAEALVTAARRLRLGEEVPFGGLTVTPAGMRRRNRELPWAELSRVEVRRGWVRAYRHPREARRARAWARQRLAATPNVRVLMALADRMARMHRPPG
jgi:hypothetical protein